MSKISKLGYGIVAFDDTCHLRNILSEIRDQIDEVVVCLQKLSYHGDPIDEKVVNYIDKLKSVGLVDDVIWFESTKEYPDDEKRGRLIETDKRNFILDFLESKGCSHAMVTDSDEFYDAEDFKNAKTLIENDDNIHLSYCEYVNYYRDYQHLLVWPFRCYVPFITEINYRFDFEKGNFPKPCDPTRRYLTTPGTDFSIFGYNVIKMHHLSWIRTDIREKIKNWSARKYFLLDNFYDKIIDRYENYKDGQNAVILFNAPNNEVCVNKLPFRYINPKYRLDEEL